MGVREGVLEEGHRLDRKRVLLTGRKCLAPQQGSHPKGKDTFGPTAGWPPTGRSERSVRFGVWNQVADLEAGMAQGVAGAVAGGRYPRPADLS